jgi:RNA exonuclease 4
MAVYRLHRKEWEKGGKQLVNAGESGKKRKRLKNNEVKGPDDGDESEDEVKHEFPGGGRKGVSSGLTTVLRRGRNREARDGIVGEKKTKWWKELARGSKDTLRLKTA